MADGEKDGNKPYEKTKKDEGFGFKTPSFTVPRIGSAKEESGAKSSGGSGRVSSVGTPRPPLSLGRAPRRPLMIGAVGTTARRLPTEVKATNIIKEEEENVGEKKPDKEEMKEEKPVKEEKEDKDVGEKKKRQKKKKN